MTSQINVRQLNEEYKISAQINTSLEKLLDETHEADADSFTKIALNPGLLALCNAGGAAILFEGKIYTNGHTPPDDEIKKLAYWLNTYTRNREFSTSRLADVYPDAKHFAATGAGVIYHPLSGLQGDAIIWFAPETLEEVNWAGDPTLAIVKSEKGLSPRNSFKQWKQILQYESKQWIKPELLATATFAHSLQKHITLILISEEERKQRQLTKQLQDANTELENINWISSHDLKEPLRKIQMSSSRILDREEATLSENVVLSLQKVDRSAKKMQQLLSDITEYNRVRHGHSAYEKVALNDVLNSVADELKDDLAEQNVTLTYSGLPEVNGIVFMLKQLFINLVRNSMKFSRESVPSVITIAGNKEPVTLPEEPEQLFYLITVTDNGIGFDNKYGENIFRVFTRLHTFEEYEGSGVGLALCKKIMQNHKGYITATGEDGVGAVFSLYFPEGR